MKLKTQDLTGAALDWAVAEAHYQESPPRKSWVLVLHKHGEETHPYSTAWDWGGPLIEREDIAMWPDQEGGWFASTDQGKGIDYHGGTALIAAMRSYVVSKLGNTIDIPEELL